MLALRILNFILTLLLLGLIIQWGRTVRRVNKIVDELELYTKQKLKGENNNE